MNVMPCRSLLICFLKKVGEFITSTSCLLCNSSETKKTKNGKSVLKEKFQKQYDKTGLQHSIKAHFRKTKPV